MHINIYQIYVHINTCIYLYFSLTFVLYVCDYIIHNNYYLLHIIPTIYIYFYTYILCISIIIFYIYSFTFMHTYIYISERQRVTKYLGSNPDFAT